ncbi:deoxyribodipyrimidine photo-lyase [Mycobacterium sp. KBS0706]|uniref:cryptochrome/photolyase family protein n=1 Tax=Mycobacterium sp. KBS0706 TaxID=2578109 RepID=UPI00110F80E5|nr:deoxyribodipyrimidine photo-lyase [Mycobacterium sp. KBS0706]TSD84478.1 deoxyribodipyrimidine photo-lyase [Mycobacterium sp. KBS0706]
MTDLLWFRQDLRLDDNPALVAAIRRGGTVIPVFILDPDGEGDWPPGGAGRWWLHHSLAALAESLAARGSRLILRQGPTAKVLDELIEETSATAVLWNRRYEPASVERDMALKSGLKQRGIASESFAAALLFEPSEIRTRSETPFKVFTPFWRACLERGGVAEPHAVPNEIPAPGRWPCSDHLAAWKLRPTRPDWAGGLRETWTPGEAGARKRLTAFLRHGLAGYETRRDRPETDGSSALSPHLHWGEIGPRRAWQAIEHAAAETPRLRSAADAYQRELGWREFAAHMLVARPEMPAEPLDGRFGAFPWDADREALQAWQKGRTGYPIVDAGMRQLWRTGWMHNRVRMIAASLLIKDLRIHWREGESWFWDTLVDADLANNAFNWQWIAGCGADAAPYFRIFNPVLQGEKFDPDGGYVRRFVPELSMLPSRWIHKPWQAPEAVLAEAGVTLGRTYPRPIVDHGDARRLALAAFETLREP